MLRAKFFAHCRVFNDVDGAQPRGLELSQHARIRKSHAVVDARKDFIANGFGDRRVRLEGRNHFVGKRIVELREYPVRGALKEVDLACLLDDFRDELNSTRRAADHAHGFARQVVVPIPTRRMKTRAFERIEPFDHGFR